MDWIQPPAAPGLLPPTGEDQKAAPSSHRRWWSKDEAFLLPENFFKEREKLKGGEKIVCDKSLNMYI